MVRKVAVVFVHGIETDDPHYADTAIGLLQRLFAETAAARGLALDDALAIVPAYWSGVMRRSERTLLHGMLGDRGNAFMGWLRKLATRVNAGSVFATLPLGAAAAIRELPGLGRLHYPALRWVMTDFIGDAISYQMSPGERRVYDRVHVQIAEAIEAAEKKAGAADAPLCVIAHSLGTLIASNYLYDLQVEASSRRSLIERCVREHIGLSPLQRGLTLAHFYTMGSPLALWALRYPDFGVPIMVPSPHFPEYHPELRGEWINFHDPDDVIAYPLRGLNPRYAACVTEDRSVNVGSLLFSWNPLVHPWYWNDRRVMAPIASALVDTAARLNAAANAGATLASVASTSGGGTSP